MQLNRAKQMFAGLADASVSHGREDIEAGRYAVLIQSISNEESRKFKPYIAFKAPVLWPICDGVGREPSSDMFDGSPAGTVADWAIFVNDYFASKVKSFLVTALGMTTEQLKEQEKAMTKAEIENEFFQYCLAMTGEEVRGNETVKTGPGIFDNTTVIEIKVTKSDAIPKEGEEGKGKVFTNVNPVRKIPLAEVADKIDENQIVRYFGSLDNFANLVAAEEG